MKTTRVIFGLLAWLAVAGGLYCWLGAVDSSQRVEGRRLSAEAYVKLGQTEIAERFLEAS